MKANVKEKKAKLKEMSMNVGESERASEHSKLIIFAYLSTLKQL